MTHVVCEPCKGCRYTDCVEVCPVECFHVADDILYIDPDECIDCAACVEECPVTAIFAEEDVPEEWEEWTEINANEAGNYPVITERLEPLKPLPE